MVFITAEIGINHNGDIGIAKKLIDTAKNANCDAVKFQKRTVEKVYSKQVLDSYRESPWGTTTRDEKFHLEFGKSEYDEINKFCFTEAIEWFASSWDIDSQEFLRHYDLKHNKVPSAMLTNLELLDFIAQEKKPTFISTGMSTMDEIRTAVRIFKKYNCPFELMHCVSTYPMKDEDANLKMINTLRERYNCNVGYSGHETGLAVSFAAAALEITSLERHITLDRAMYGSDQSASVEPSGFRMLIGGVRKIEQAMGDGKKYVLDSEVPIAKKLRAHLKWEANE